MQRRLALAALLLCLMPAAARAELLRCSQIPAAQHFVDGLKPGPNTRAAQRHLDAAKRATSDKACDKELRQVDRYARRSAAADKRQAAKAKGKPAREARRRPAVPCADLLHQDRPGGSDYHGAPVPGCPRRP